MAAATVLLAVGGYLLSQLLVEEAEGPYRCVVQGGKDQQPYELEPQMIRNAATIEAVGTSRGLPERAVTIALATAMQESMLRNIDYGDRDSVGLFQQRPSQGWGTVEQIMDPVYSAGKFYERLEEVPNYTELPLTVAAQKVQLSGFPDEYAKHEPEASQLTAALTGRRAGALNCAGKQPEERQVAGDAVKARKKLEAEFGQGVLPSADESQADGESATPPLTIPVRADGDGAGTDGGAAEDGAKNGERQRSASQRGWQLAHWSLANASHLGVERITYGKHVWDAGDSAEGWQETDTADAADAAEVKLTFAQ